METGEIQSKLKDAVSGSVLEKSRFGRSAHQALWVEGKALPRIAAFLAQNEALAFDWLENLSAIQMDEALVLTYFVRSSRHGHQVILRATVEPGGPSKEAALPSVAGTWAMAAPFEAEIQEFFGVRFSDEHGEPAHPGRERLPTGWKGFPLRKSYVFPTEFLGVAHVRRVNEMGPEGIA